MSYTCYTSQNHKSNSQQQQQKQINYTPLFLDLEHCILIDNIWIFSQGFQKNICNNKGFEDAATVPTRHRWEKGSFNWPHFMLQWFIRFPEFAEFMDFPFFFRQNPNGFIDFCNILTISHSRSDHSPVNQSSRMTSHLRSSVKHHIEQSFWRRQLPPHPLTPTMKCKTGLDHQTD